MARAQAQRRRVSELRDRPALRRELDDALHALHCGTARDCDRLCAAAPTQGALNTILDTVDTHLDGHLTL